MQTYYTLLNCGFRMRITAGTGAGVHPVPLGHGRVYVHTGSEFFYENWLRHLNHGHSFVTTGPLMNFRFNGELPGTTWYTCETTNTVVVTGTVVGLNRLKSIEIIQNGRIASKITPQPERTSEEAWRYSINASIEFPGSGWVALRCFEELPDDKVSFAHTNPVYVDVESRPLIPRRRDADFFVRRMDEEISRNRSVLSAEALEEYRRARDVYQNILERAKDGQFAKEGGHAVRQTTVSELRMADRR